MALENKRDRDRTQLRRFQDRRSFVSLAGHDYLFGRDVEPRRREVFERECGRCWNCGAYYGWDYGHLEHIQGGYGPQRCWCAHNLRWGCPKCHMKHHGRYPRFGEETECKITPALAGHTALK
jgi:hypothetical protein